MPKNKVKDLPEKPYTPANAPQPLSKCIDEIYEEFGDGTVEYLGIKTGLKGLDEATLGLSGLIVLSAKAGGGKTSLAIQLAYGACETDKTPTIYYSLEMSRNQILARLLTQISGVESKKIFRAGKQAGDNAKYGLSQDDYKKLQQAKEKLRQLGDKIYIITRADSEINFITVKEQIELVKQIHKADKVFVVIDHLQIFSIDPAKFHYVDQIGKETALINGFKDLQVKTNATVLLIAQENKKEYDKGKIEAVKGSVDIIYLADLVMHIVGEKKDDIADDAYEVFEVDQDAMLKITKNRYGETKRIRLRFNGKITKFSEV